jgi:hypothetical protein
LAQPRDVAASVYIFGAEGIRVTENVLVNDADAAIRQNRLALLVKLRTVSERVADFSKLAGG